MQKLKDGKNIKIEHELKYDGRRNLNIGVTSVTRKKSKDEEETVVKHLNEKVS